MSAFVVNDQTINVIVKAAAKHLTKRDGRMMAFYQDSETNWMTPTELGQNLLKENYRSVEHRYNDESEDTWKMYKYKDPGHTITHNEKHYNSTDPMMVLKLISCLEYQSCETDDWRETPAYKILKGIENRLISALPGYDDAPWGL